MSTVVDAIPKCQPRLPRLLFLVGLVILQLLTLIPIVGGLVGFLAVVFGLGLLIISLLRATLASLQLLLHLQGFRLR